MVAASLGALGGDAALLGAGYGVLQLFANGTIAPTATNFRRVGYVLAGSALVVPPLTAVLFARLTGRRPMAGSTWTALLLATIGDAVAIGAGLLAAPQFWVTLPVQLLAVAVGTTVGLHWGPRDAEARTRVVAPERAVQRDAPEETPGPAAILGFGTPICPDV
jgi:hypothetical protein